MDQYGLSKLLGIDVSACFKARAYLKGHKLTFNHASVTENTCFADIAVWTCHGLMPPPVLAYPLT